MWPALMASWIAFYTHYIIALVTIIGASLRESGGHLANVVSYIHFFFCTLSIGQSLDTVNIVGTRTHHSSASAHRLAPCMLKTRLYLHHCISKLV